VQLSKGDTMSLGLQRMMSSVVLGVVFAVLAGEAAAQDCASDTDCGRDSFCNLTAEQKNSGKCTSGEVACENDDQCPDGLSCEAGKCALVVQRCKTDGECARDHRCVDMTPCDAEGGSDECESGDDKLCYPTRIECEADEECPDGWNCVAAASEGADRGSSACFPRGFALALKGHATIAPDRTSDEQQASDGSGTASQANAESSSCSISAVGSNANRSALLVSIVAGALLFHRSRRARRRL
jgi:hypothetical protein